MTTNRVVIVGAGGFGREVYALLSALAKGQRQSPKVIGFVDDGSPDRLALDRLRVPLLGDLEHARRLDAEYIIGIGSPAVRRSIDERLVAMGLSAAEPVVHPMAWVGPDVELGPGTVVCAGAAITTNVRCGRHVHLNLGATIGHDCTLGDFVTIAPLSAVSGNSTIEAEGELGTGASVLPGRVVGAGAMVGAQGLVAKDVPSHTIVVGVPAKPR